MGVDISTYRCRIGCFSGISGTAVTFICVCCGFGYGLKTIMSMLLIGSLLLMAGIESNPGPPKQGQNDNITRGTLLPSASNPSTLPLYADVKLFLVVNSCFPRYEYALENVLDILKRYKNVFNLSNKGEPVPRHIAFYLCKANYEADFPCNIEDISQKSRLEGCFKCPFTRHGDCLIEIDKAYQSVFVVSTKLWESMREQEATYFICARSAREARAVSKQQRIRSHGNNLTIRKETAGQQIETYLEKTIFNDLNPVCEVLCKNIENAACYTRKEEYMTKQSRNKCEEICKQFKNYAIENDVLPKHLERVWNKTCMLREQNKHRKRSGAPINIEHSKNIKLSEEAETAEGIYVRHRDRKHANMTQTAAINKNIERRKKASSKKTYTKSTTCSTNSHKGEVEGPQQLSNLLKLNEEVLQTIKEQTKECLLEEFIGVYNMSNVSVAEMPNIPQYRDKVALKTLSKHLFQQCQHVTGIGYRMGKLQINVEEKNQNNDTADKYTEIRQLLKEHNIQEYDIVPMSLKTYLTPGDEIRVTQKGGSFGCFAKMKDMGKRNETPCGLLSKHVASTIKERSEILAKKDGKFKTVGHILPESITGGGLDIAAATLSIPLQECETRFKSLRGKPLETGREKLTKTARLQGNKVHMWGAVSKPGKGIITVPEYFCKGMDHTLIQVEDIVDGEQIVEKRFAQPGDSGAVTCADDPGQKVVHPVSMNMGCMNYEEVERDNQEREKTKRGKYLTVPLQSGLDQLSRRTGNNFYLY